MKLADPDVVSNQSEYQKLAQSMSELDEVFAHSFSVQNLQLFSGFLNIEFNFRL